MNNITKHIPYPKNILRAILGEDSFKEYIETVKDIDIENAIEKIYKTLTPKECAVLKSRYIDRKTLTEVGLDFGVSRERIRQIEAKALRKMRHPARLQALYGEEIIFNNSSPNLIKYPFLSSLNLSTRTFNALCRAGYTDYYDFDRATQLDFMKVRGLRKKIIL